MKDCSSCKDSFLNNSKLAGKVFEETPCLACVIEDQSTLIGSFFNVQQLEIMNPIHKPITDLPPIF